MAKTKTADELREEARKAEERAKQLRRRADALTKAEQAKLNAEIIAAFDEWRLAKNPPIEKAELPGIIRSWTERNRQRTAEKGG